jgi:hypothetical protein
MLQVSALYPRTLTKTSKKYRALINESNGKKNIYRTVYHFDHLKDGKPDFSDIIIDQVFFDFDDCDNTYPEVLNFINALKTDNVKFRINFSGRGFHVYVGSEHVNMERKTYLKLLYEHIIEKYSLQNVDPSTIGDIKQLRRIENTLNIRSDLYCIPLTYQEMQHFTLNDIKELAKQPRDFDVFWTDGVNIKLDNINIDDHINEIHIDRGNGEFKEIDNMLSDPCIVRILHLTHPGQDERFLLCLYLSHYFRDGKDINDFNLEQLKEKIILYMRSLNWEDYSESMNTAKSTRYQVTNIISKKYNFVPNCDWRKMRGICISEFCWKSKNINSNKT